MTEQTPPAVDLFDPEVQRCPWDAYGQLRDEAPVFIEPRTGMYVVTRYEDVRAVLTDPERFRSAGPRSGASAELSDRERRTFERFRDNGWVPAPTLASRDDPEHKQLRNMFNGAFRPAKIKQLDPIVERIAGELVDDFIDDGQCNFVAQFAVPLPLQIIGLQMGAKKDDLARIKTWTDAFFRRISMMLPPDEQMATVDLEIEAQHYFQAIFEQLREVPDDSLLSDLVNTVVEGWGRPLSDNELHAEMMADTFVGGSETTTNALSAGVKLLIENPNVWDQLKSDPDRYLRTFAEEVLRLESPVQSLMRVAGCDIDLGGVTIPQDALINVRYAAANRDPEHFDCPAELNLDRRNAASHMAFGSGVHHCLGAPLARRELHYGFKTLVERFDELHFAEGRNDFTYHPHFLLRSLKALHIEFTAAR